MSERLVRAALLVLTFTLSGAVGALAGDRLAAPATLAPAVANYTRVNDDVAAAGRFGPGAIDAIRAAGFAAVLDLRGPGEVEDAEVAAVEAAGLRRFNLPVTGLAPTKAQVAAFARLLKDRANLPILVQCVSANRVGAIWALHQAARGVPAAAALAEGRRIGLRGAREAAVAHALGLRREQGPSDR